MDADNLLSNLMLTAGMALVALVLMRRLYKRTRSRNSEPSSPRSPRQASQPLIDAPPELTRWQVEMHEVARELRAELDTKAVMVQALVTMLQEEITRLESVVAKVEAAAGSERSVPADSDVLAEISRLAAEIAADSEQASARAGLSGPAAQQLIYSLADQGRAAAEIARVLSLPEGEVELAMSIRRL